MGSPMQGVPLNDTEKKIVMRMKSEGKSFNVIAQVLDRAESTIYRFWTDAQSIQKAVAGGALPKSDRAPRKCIRPECGKTFVSDKWDERYCCNTCRKTNQTRVSEIY